MGTAVSIGKLTTGAHVPSGSTRAIRQKGSKEIKCFLRDAFQAGRPGPWTKANTDAAHKLYDLLTELGGEGFKAEAGPFTPEIFNDPTAASPNAG